MSSQNLSSKNLTTSVIKNVNVKPLNSTTVPAVVTVPATTGGRRHVKRVKKTKPYSIFSLAGRRTKSKRRPTKVKSSRTLTKLGGARTKKAHRSKKAKSKRSKSKVSVGGKKSKKGKKTRSHKKH